MGEDYIIAARVNSVTPRKYSVLNVWIPETMKHALKFSHIDELYIIQNDKKLIDVQNLIHFSNFFIVRPYKAE